MVQLSQFLSPLGPVAVAECAGRVMAVGFGDIQELLSQTPGLASYVCSRSGEPGPGARTLRDYLEGTTSRLRVKVDLTLIPGEFDREVLRALFRTRPGSTITYGELAAELGRPGAARAVGGAMRRNPIPIAIPCHRVLPTGGGIGNYTGGVEKKAWLLAREGVSTT